MGVSLILRRPYEELAFITFENINLEAFISLELLTIDLIVDDLQIDNQLLDSTYPVLLCTSKINSKDFKNQNALAFSAKISSFITQNTVICEYVVFSIQPCIVRLDERFILKIAMFLDFGADQNNVKKECSKYHVLLSSENRYYFEHLYIGPIQVRKMHLLFFFNYCYCRCD